MQFEPVIQAKLEQMARESGRAAAELVKDAVAGCVDEYSAPQAMLNSRYDDLKRGRVSPLEGESAIAFLHQRIEARRNGAA
ncbi:MAG: hypothetical protein K2X03_09065 [Bryobacteraceae bacterium]|nr:hypothetical protein [Bryobacteraceae bacterium]